MGPRAAILALLCAAFVTAAACGGAEEDDFQAPGDVGEDVEDTNDSGVDASPDPDADAPDAGPSCGNGIIDSGEECDGAALDGATCESAGFVGGDIVCASDCTLDLSGCASGECGNDEVEAGEECDGDNLAGQTCGDLGFEFGVLACDACLFDDSACSDVPMCGDGVQEGTEACDDGNTVDEDGCASDCVPEDCGDGVVQVGLGEECDSGSVIVPMCDEQPDGPTGIAYCATDCTFDELLCPDIARCGDGTLDLGEACDDGGTMDGDGCDANCQSETCGDDTVDPLEACDGDDLGAFTCADFGFNAGAVTCQSCAIDFTGCRMSVCGDGMLEGPESCDDGNRVDGDGCDRRCRLESCGNGTVEGDEACDDGAANSDTDPDACRTDCTEPECGDGVVDSSEACDLGTDNGMVDGCRLDCTVPMCGDGIIDVLERCDDGMANSDSAPDACRLDCQPARCGDSVVDMGEECDDGNMDGGDGCTPGCSSETMLDPPIAVIMANRLTGEAPLSIAFNASDSTGLGTLRYFWEFGDGADSGTPSEIPFIEHTFNDVGMYTVTLTVTDMFMQTGQTTAMVEVTPDNQAPTAAFTPTPERGCSPQLVSFDASASMDPDGSIVDWAWTFGDGGMGSGETVDHTYVGEGNYIASLTVTDDGGRSDTTGTTVTIRPEPAPGEVVWAGGAPGAINDWGEPSNWCPPRVPTSTDNVVIPQTVTPPIFATGSSIGSLSVEPMASMTINGRLTVLGDVNVQGTVSGVAPLLMAGPGQLSGTLNTVLEIQDAVTISGTAGGFRTLVRGPNAEVILADGRLEAPIRLEFTNGAVLTMTDPSGFIDTDDFQWGGSAVTATAGTLQVRNFTQLDEVAGVPFVASGNHVFQTADESSPALVLSAGANQAEFQEVVIQGRGPGTITGDLVVNGDLDVSTLIGTFSSIDSAIVAGDFSLAESFKWTVPVVMTGDNVSIPAATGSDLTILGSVIIGRATVVGGDLLVSGSGATFNLGAQTLRVTGETRFEDGALLVMDQPGTQLTAEGAFVYGGADTTGLVTMGELVVDGAFTQLDSVGGASFVASDTHSTRFTDDVSCDATTASGASAATFGDVTFQSAFTCNVAGQLNVLGDLDLRGLDLIGDSDLSVTGDIVTDGSSRLQFPTIEWLHPAPQLDDVYWGDLTIHGLGVVTDIFANVQGDMVLESGARLDLNGIFFSVAGNMSFLPGSTYVATDAMSGLDVSGVFSYSGTDTTGAVNLGNLVLFGDFVQVASMSDPGAFVAASSFFVDLNGFAGPQSVSASGDLRQAYLGSLAVNNANGVTFDTDLAAFDLRIEAGSSATFNADGTLDNDLNLFGTLVMSAGTSLSVGNRIVLNAGSTLDNSAGASITCGTLVNAGGTVLGPGPSCP